MTSKKQKVLVWGLRGLVILFGLVSLFFLYVMAKTFGIVLVERTWSEVYCGLLCLMFVPIFAALADAWMILGDIGRNNSFCENNARRLMRISRYAWVVTAMLLIVTLCRSLRIAPSATTQSILALEPDGLMVLGIFLMLAGVATAVAAAALSYLTRKAAAIQDENDLTI